MTFLTLMIHTIIDSRYANLIQTIYKTAYLQIKINQVLKKGKLPIKRNFHETIRSQENTQVIVKRIGLYWVAIGRLNNIFTNRYLERKSAERLKIT